MQPNPTPDPDSRLADSVVRAGLLAPESAQQFLREVARRRADGANDTFATLVLERGLVTPEQLGALEPTGFARPPAASVVLSGLPASGSAVCPGVVLRDRIAQGGMGAIFVADDEAIGRKVAVKVARPGRDPTVFVAEARVTGQLEHPNIVPIHSVGRRPDGLPYFTMKLVEGRTLAAAIAEGIDDQPAGTAAALPRYLEAFLKVCDAVAFAHSRGIVHCDLKPENVMLGDYGEVLLMDWGIARERPGSVSRLPRPAPAPSAAEPGEQTPSGVSGTPRYMSPEQASGDPERVDVPSDVYGLGAILYAILTGGPPVSQGTGIGVIAHVVQGNIASPAERAPDRFIPRELAATAMKALALRPRDRYQTVRALQADVRRYIDGRSVSAAPDSFPRAVVKLARRNRAASVVSAVSAALLIGLGALAYVSILRERDRALDERNRAREAEASARDALGAQQRAERDRTAADERRLALLHVQKTLAELRLALQRGERDEGELIARYDGMLESSTGDPALERLVRLEKARALTVLRREREALGILSDLRERSPDDREAREAMLEAHLSAFADMTPAFEAFLADYAREEPRSGVAALLEALRMPSSPARVELLSTAISRDGRLSLAYLMRAYELLKRKESNPARIIEDCDAAIAISPMLAKAYGNRGYARLKDGQIDGALADLDHALALDPGLAYAHRERGRLLLTVGRRAEGIAAVERAILLDPKEGSAHRLLITSLHEAGDERWQAALARYRGVAGDSAADAVARALLAPQSPAEREAASLDTRARVLRTAGRTQEAIEAFRRATELDPTNLSALLGHGSLALELGLLDETARVAARAEQAAPGDWRPTSQLATVAEKRGQVDRALELLRRSREKAGSDGAVVSHVTVQEAVLLTNADRLDDARKLVSARLRDDATNGFLHFVLGAVEARQGKSDAAFAAYAQALRFGCEEALVERAKLHAQLGQREEARRDLTEALERAPTKRAQALELLRQLGKGEGEK